MSRRALFLQDQYHKYVLLLPVWEAGIQVMDADEGQRGINDNLEALRNYSGAIVSKIVIMYDDLGNCALVCPEGVDGQYLIDNVLFQHVDIVPNHPRAVARVSVYGGDSEEMTEWPLLVVKPLGES